MPLPNAKYLVQANWAGDQHSRVAAIHLAFAPASFRPACAALRFRGGLRLAALAHLPFGRRFAADDFWPDASQSFAVLK
jgi:hypothetical protein